MKKILALTALLAISALAFTGCGLGMPSCGGETASSEILSPTPWSNLYNYEKTEYDITRFAATETEEGGFEANEDVVLADGKYVTEIMTADRDISEWEELGTLADIPYFNERISGKLDELSSSPSAYSLIRTTFELTYTDSSENGAWAGETDTMESVVLLRNINMMPVFSYKTADLRSSGITYTVFADYLAGENIYSETGGTETVDERITLIGTTNYDNETFYLLERAQSGLNSGLSTSFSVHNAVETGVYDDEAVNTIAASVTTDTADDPADNFAYDTYGPDDDSFVTEYLGDSVRYYDEAAAEEAGVNAGYSIPVNRAVFYRNATNMGTSVTAYYSDVDFDYYGIKTSNVLMYFATYETNTEGVATNVTVAEISDYSIIK